MYGRPVCKTHATFPFSFPWKRFPGLNISLAPALFAMLTPLFAASSELPLDNSAAAPHDTAAPPRAYTLKAACEEVHMSLPGATIISSGRPLAERLAQLESYLSQALAVWNGTPDQYRAWATANVRTALGRIAGEATVEVERSVELDAPLFAGLSLPELADAPQPRVSMFGGDS